MKRIILIPILLIFFFSSTVSAQTKQDTATVTIESKSSGKIIGQIVSDSRDTIKIKTEHFGIVSIAKKEIIHRNLVSIQTEDGNEFLGKIVKDDAFSIILETEKLGEITIAKSDIVTQKDVDAHQMKHGSYWFENPQSTRYLWSPNGYGLKKGEGYYQNIWVLWNQFSYGLSDKFSIGAGVIPLFLFTGPTPVFVTAKFSIPVVEDKFNVGGGAIFGTVIGEEDGGLGIFYGLTTFGSRDNNVTLGMGYGYAGGTWASAPMINLNGMFRISKRGYIITENYLLSTGSESVVILSIGGRSIIRRAALDYGLLIPAVGDGGIAIPWLGFTVPFGKV
jgi:RNase P/RNase MRP subunit p29